jgi:hypothetical protein
VKQITRGSKGAGTLRLPLPFTSLETDRQGKSFDCNLERTASGRGAASFLLKPFCGIQKHLFLFIRNREFCEAAIQAHENLRKNPNNGFVETIESAEMEGDFAAKGLHIL